MALDYSREIERTTLSNSSTKVVEIPRVDWISEIQVNVEQTIGAATATGNVLDYVSAIRVIGDSNVHLKSFTPTTARGKNHYEFGTTPRNEASNATAGNSGTISLQFSEPGRASDIRGIPAFKFNKLTLEVDTNAVSTVDSNATPTAVQTLIVQVVGTRKLAGDDKISSILYISEIESNDQLASAAVSAYVQKRQELGKVGIIRKLFIYYTDNGSADDDAVDTVALVTDTDQPIIKVDPKVLAGSNEERFEAEARDTGMYMLELPNGLNAEAVDKVELVHELSSTTGAVVSYYVIDADARIIFQK